MSENPIKSRHLGVIEKYGGKKGGYVLAALATGEIIYPLVRKGYDWFHRREAYTITVGGSDDIYPDLHEWVLERIPEEDRKALIAVTDESFGDRVRNSKEEGPPPVRLRYDGSRTQEVEIDGCTVTVTVSREDYPGGRDKLPDNWRRIMEKVTFTATTPKGRDAIVRMIEGLVKKKHEDDGPPPLLMPGRWGGNWIKRGDLPVRTIESVILKDGQLERLIADLKNFLDSEDKYTRVNQPWHRGYLFYGEPGTGKTSIARALANYFDMPMHYLPLGDLDRDADLINLVTDIKPRSMLLLEDIDVYHAATDRDEEAGTTTVASMLNALDGVFTPHGLITVMTTNKREELDDALIRAGRVDVDEEFTSLDEQQAARLYEWCYSQPCMNGTVKEFVGRSPADLIKALRIKQQKELTC